MKRIGIGERRARIAVRHHVADAERVSDLGEAVRGVVALHASEPATVYLSAWARMTELSIEAMDRALYDDRSLLRMLAMRRTMFVVNVEDAPILHAAASRGVARGERKGAEDLVARLGVEDVGRWMQEAEAEALAALEHLGEATAQELAKAVPRLRQKVRVSVGKRYEADIGMSSRMLLVLAVEGKVARGRPRGTWISRQYRWTPLDRWLGDPMVELPIAGAQAELVRRWLARFGPGTEADLRWWTGWTLGEVRRALHAIGALQVDMDGQIGLVLPDDLEPIGVPAPWVALLPALDPTTMGWQARDWYLGDYRSILFDSSGNAGPTIWADGRIVGGWAIRASGEVVTKVLEDVGRETTNALAAEAARLTEWLIGVPVIPRFPTPFHRELAG